MIFYFTGTGNSLYAAKHFDKELYSIPQELKKDSRKYKADSIGIVCPLYEFDLPVIVKDFILNSQFETDYFYIVMTYGMHHGGCAARNAAFFEQAGRRVHAGGDGKGNCQRERDNAHDKTRNKVGHKSPSIVAFQGSNKLRFEHNGKVCTFLQYCAIYLAGILVNSPYVREAARCAAS